MLPPRNGFKIVPSDNRNTRSTCPTSVSTGTGQSEMSSLIMGIYTNHAPSVTDTDYKLFY